MEKVCGRSNAVSKALYQTLTGFSPVMAQELCYRASIDGNDDVQTLDENTREQLYTEFTRLMEPDPEGRIYPGYCFQRGRAG